MAGHEAFPPNAEDFMLRNFMHHPDFPSYLNSDEIEIPLENWTHLACPYTRCPCCGSLQPHTNTLLITICGSCPHPYRRNTPMSTGVQFRIQGFNMCRAIGADAAPTKLKAEMLAAVQALDVVRVLARPGNLPVEGLSGLKHVVLKTESRKLVEGMCCLEVEERSRAGFGGVGGAMGGYGMEGKVGGMVVGSGAASRLSGELLELAPLLVVLDMMVREINALGVWVQFWRVAPGRVGGAERLAGEALQERDVLKEKGIKW